jgi:hypothetical protein
VTFLSVTAIAVIAVSAISFVSQAQTYAATPGGSPISSHILLLLPFDNLSGTLSGPSDPASAQSPRQRVQPGHSRLDRISNAAPKIFNSRFLIRCKAVARMDLAQVSTLCGAAMREFGVPELIRTANGAPFAGVGLPGLSKLTLGWTKLGIVHALFQSGYPQLNGRNERMHRTLKEEATKSPARTVTAQQKKLVASAMFSTMNARMRRLPTRLREASTCPVPGSFRVE